MIPILRSGGFLFFRTLVKIYKAMKTLLTKIGKAAWGTIIAILTYIFLMIDRTVLIPFQMISSYSATELQKKPERYSAYAMIRVTAAILIAAIITILKYIF